MGKPSGHQTIIPINMDQMNFSKTASFIKMLINDSIIFVLNFTGVSYCIRDTFWKIHLIHIDGQWQVNNIYMSAWGLNFVILYYDTSPVCYVYYLLVIGHQYGSNEFFKHNKSQENIKLPCML